MNVTGDEATVAVRLQAPVNGTAPGLWPLGFKSSGRRLFAAAGIPAPPGTEGVRTADDLRLAIASLRKAQPGLAAAVVKLDNSVSGDGNQVIALQDPAGSPASARAVAGRVASMPDWYLAELARGGVVEAYVAGEYWSSPSVQIEITPEGRAVVLATHEQILGGDNGQVYQGCRFPARRDYVMRLTKYGQRAGQLLAGHQVIGMVSTDFVAARDRGQPWRLYALEVNLRRGGTTAPIVVLSSLLPGRYDAHGRWELPDGSARCYRAPTTLGTRGGPGCPWPRHRWRTLRRAGVRPPDRDRCGAAHAVRHRHRRQVRHDRNRRLRPGGRAPLCHGPPRGGPALRQVGCQHGGYAGRRHGRPPPGSAAAARTRLQAAQRTDPAGMSLLVADQGAQFVWVWRVRLRLGPTSQM